jgi:hypothetical protein
MTSMRNHVKLTVAAVALCSLAGCVRASDEPKPPARQSPVAVPSASPSASSAGEVTPPVDIDPETGETVGLRASATVAITLGGKTTSVALEQTELAESSLEQTSGETKRVLRLNVADPKRAEDVQLSVDGEASLGSHKTREGLRVAFYYTPLGIDLLSEDGTCRVEFTRVDVLGAAGTVVCTGIKTESGEARLSADFTAEAL